MGGFNITEPYIDASTGEMCYSVSKLLSDGSTVVRLDFNLGEIQQYIEEMSENGSQTSFIVDSSGMMIGHSEPEYVGKDYKDLDFYHELVNRVYMLHGDSFKFNFDNVNIMFFPIRPIMNGISWYA